MLQLNRNSIKKNWKTINELLGKKKSQIPKTFQCNGKLFTEPIEITNQFINYFINIGKTVSHAVPQSIHSSQFYRRTSVVDSIFLSPVHTSELINVSKYLRGNASCGIDNVSCKVVKRVIHAIVLPLVHVFNLSIVSGKVSLKLKESKVIPVFKKDGPGKFVN